MEFAFGFISREDQQRLSATTSGSSGQQVWEALAVLAALRLWKGYWLSRRIVLEVKSDSVTALVMLIKLKATGVGAGIISREVALDIADALYEPAIASHVPGVANVIADHLSCMAERSSSPLPAPLRQAQQQQFEERSAAWWRTVD